jgi:two-component system response regulator AtoC
MLTATKTVKTAVRAMKAGAFDYVTKPFDVDELLLLVERAAQSAALQREVTALRSEVGQRYSFDSVIGRSPAMQAVLDTVSRVAPLRTTVLLTGESGTGKEVIAKAIHYNSPRASGPLVAINCAAIPENLLESELFGHERGAFTDAHAR